MADKEQQTATEDAGVSAADLAALKGRAEAAEARTAEVTAAATELARQRDEAVGRHVQEIGRRVQADETALTQAISAATSEGDAAEREYAEAVAANDAGAMAKAQRRMTTATIHLEQATTNHANLQAWKQREARRAAEAEEQRKRQPPPPAPQQTQTTSENIDISGYTQPTQDWLRRHPELIKNTPEAKRARDRVIADHYVATSEGLTEDTPSYFEHLERGYQERAQTNGSPYSQAAETLEVDLERQEPARQTRQDPPPRTEQSRQSSALPPSRSSPPARSSPPGRVTLTVGEQEAARASWPHLKPDEAYREFAVNKVALQQEGRL